MKPVSRKRRRHWNRQLKRNPQSTRGIWSTMKLMGKLKTGRRYRPKLKLQDLFDAWIKSRRLNRENRVTSPTHRGSHAG